MPSLARRLFAEWLGTAFLLAAVVGSGIMAQKLAGGNVALALLCNTIPTGAILVVLILIFGPLSGAHFNPAVTVAFALRRELPWPMAAGYIAAQIVGAIAGVWAAHLMFELPVATFDHLARRRRAVVGRGCRDIRIAADDLRLRRTNARRHPLRGRPLHHIGLLVHGLNVVRQSGCDDRAIALRHFRGYRAFRRTGFHHGPTRWNGGSRIDRTLALGFESRRSGVRREIRRHANGLPARFRNDGRRTGNRFQVVDLSRPERHSAVIRKRIVRHVSPSGTACAALDALRPSRGAGNASKQRCMRRDRRLHCADDKPGMRR
jgi:hypothetical protein